MIAKLFRVTVLTGLVSVMVQEQGNMIKGTETANLFVKADDATPAPEKKSGGCCPNGCEWNPCTGFGLCAQAKDIKLFGCIPCTCLNSIQCCNSTIVNIVGLLVVGAGCYFGCCAAKKAEKDAGSAGGKSGPGGAAGGAGGAAGGAPKQSGPPFILIGIGAFVLLAAAYYFFMRDDDDEEDEEYVEEF